MTEYSYEVRYKPEGVNTDISNYIQHIEITDVGTGEVTSAIILLNAMNGQFITNTLSGATPIIGEFDKIKITITDRDTTTYIRVYEVDIMKPMENAQQGTVLHVELLGLEHHLMKVPFAKQYYFDSGFNVVKDICDIYNNSDAKGLGQTVIAQHTTDSGAGGGNDLPKFTAGHYTFNVAEQFCYDGLMEVVDRMGTSVSAGGGGDFFELYFARDPASNSQVLFRAFPSGGVDSGVILTDSVSVNPAEQEGGIESTAGTVTATWGADDFGSMPAQVSHFSGALEAWRLMPNYVAGSYKQGAIVQRVGTGPDGQGDTFHYKALSDTSGAPPSTETSNANWTIYYFTDFLTNEIGITGGYSPWTNINESEWRNSGANVSGTTGNDPPLSTSVYVWDANQVVYDGAGYRTWVDWQGTNPSSIPSQYLYSGTTVYRGFRGLVNGTGAGLWAGFNNNIVQYDGTNWYVMKVTSNGQYCCVDHEAKIYKKAAGVWSLADGDSMGNDAYHPVYSLTTTQGHNNKSDGAGFNFGRFTAITYEFRFERSDITSTTARKFYRQGAWMNLKFPFPHSTYNGVSAVGYLFGNNTTKREPVTLDINNMHLSPSGKQGFNHTEADEFGPLGGIRFATKLEWKRNKDASGGFVNFGNFGCRCFMYDTEDNVVISDFTIPFNGLWEPVIIPFSSFKPYRARIPLSLGPLNQLVFLQGLEILNVFNFKNIKKIGFQWMGPYDDEGRFNPAAKADFLFPSIIDIITGLFITGYNVKWHIDAFHFTKALLAVTPPKTAGGERAIFPRFFEEPLISNDYQLTQSNLAKLEITKFRHKEYEITTEGHIDVDYGESFYLRNIYLIPDSDNGANTIKLVAKKLKYTIDKAPTGVSGFLRTITGVKRLTS